MGFRRRYSRTCQKIRRFLSIILPNRVTRRIFRNTSTIPIDGHSGSPRQPSQDTHQPDSSIVRGTHPDSPRFKRHAAINDLPDSVLLHIFNLTLGRTNDSPHRWHQWPWHRLVHVCQRWRSVIFASPDVLNLKLVFEPVTRLELLAVWPPLPIIVRNIYHSSYHSRESDYNFNSVLMHRDRICAIHLRYSRRSQFERLVSAMQGQFPALTYLALDYFSLRRSSAPALPVWFLGGHAPRLQTLELNFISFPSLPKLLLSATGLVRLTLRAMPHSGYISPETMVTCLFSLTNLESLTIHFHSPSSCPDLKTRRPPPSIRHVLPALKFFRFIGVSEYLEDVVSQIDAPILDTFNVVFFNQVVFDTPHLSHFILRADNLKPYRRASVFFDSHAIFINVQRTIGFEGLKLVVMCEPSDWQFSALEQMCNGQASPLMPIIPGVESLDISVGRGESNGHIDVDGAQWLEFLRPFIAVESLNLWTRIVPFIMPVLAKGVQVAPEFLPALRHLQLEGSTSFPESFVEDVVEPFIAARQVLGNPVVLDLWY